MLRTFVLLAFSFLSLQGASPWDLKTLSKAPQYEQVDRADEVEVRALFFNGMPWKGKPTRVFAWYGAPKVVPGQKVPAMVLVHGGGGTAFAEWVRIWNRRGYAAIAMDTCGSIPKARGTSNPLAVQRERHPQGGPEGWGGFDQTAMPKEDQWPFHAVSAVILAHSLLRTFPEVDVKRIGLTGISWGGYLTDIVASVDSRFRFAAPVYGCGFLGEDSAWLPTFAKMSEPARRGWLETWDPSRYLGHAKVPLLWVSGTNDFAYPMPSLQKSYRLPRSKRTLAIRVAMKHNHSDGAKPAEIAAYADALFKKGTGLAQISSQGVSGEEAWVRFRTSPVQSKAEFNYTLDSGKWQERKWQTVVATIDPAKGTAKAKVPECATAFYLNLVDTRGLVTSTEHVERKSGCTAAVTSAK